MTYKVRFGRELNKDEVDLLYSLGARFGREMMEDDGGLEYPNSWLSMLADFGPLTYLWGPRAVCTGLPVRLLIWGDDEPESAP